MSWRLSGPAALRSAAQDGLGEGSPPLAGLDLAPAHLLPFALTASLILGLGGTGVLPLPAVVCLDLGALFCYLLGLRAALPGWASLRIGPEMTEGMAPVLLPVAALLSAAVVMAQRPDLLWLLATAAWLLGMLVVSPWLDLAEQRRDAPELGSTALVVLIISVPIPVLALAMSAVVPAPVRALAVGAAVLIPSYRLIAIFGRRSGSAWRRALMVTAIVTLAAGLSAPLGGPEPLLPAVILLGWYGLGGVASQRERATVGAFAGFVVLAAAILAIAAPV